MPVIDRSLRYSVAFSPLHQHEAFASRVVAVVVARGVIGARDSCWYRCQYRGGDVDGGRFFFDGRS